MGRSEGMNIHRGAVDTVHPYRRCMEMSLDVSHVIFIRLGLMSIFKARAHP